MPQRIRELTGEDLAALHDPCAVLAVTHPDRFGFGAHSVRIELDGKYTRGMTVIDRRVENTGPVEVAWNVDAPAVLALIAQSVARAERVDLVGGGAATPVRRARASRARRPRSRTSSASAERVSVRRAPTPARR